MSGNSKLRYKIRSQITRFTSRLTRGMGKVKSRFLREMIYGIQAGRDIKVSNIARELNESIPLIKTENRLCRNLADLDLTESVNDYLCWEGAGQVRRDTVLAVDLGDVRKDYAKKMEYMARVRDGSKGEIADGYWLCQIVAAHPCEDNITPLYGELYSQNAEGFHSENAQILKAVNTVAKATERRGIVAIDRGGDRRSLLIPLIKNGLRFVVRQEGKRHIVLPGGSLCSVQKAARWCKSEVERKIELEKDGIRKVRKLRLGSLPVKLPERPQEQLWLVVIRGFGKAPVILLTNVVPTPVRKHCLWIGELYLTRWKCEETYRFLKSTYNLEDVRVRSYTGLRNTYALLNAVMYFVSVVVGAKPRLNIIFKQICEKAKRFYEIANFYQYAIADGIHRLLYASEGRLTEVKHRDSPHTQTLLNFARPPS